MLKVEHITFGYSQTSILEDINFSVHRGENLAVIGESGSGKSTLLKLIYGQYDLGQGHIFWKDTEILGPKFNLVIGYDFMKQVTQEFDLMPYTTVEENIGKYLSRFYLKEGQKRIEELIKVVELEPYAKAKVKTLSGGQKQRVAIARALAKQPEILLLDEPFSHIDNFKKQSLRRSVFKFLKDNHITCLTATHDKDDVLGFADTMVVLHNGQILENDTPINLFKNPKTPLIASFFGEFSRIEPFGIVYAHQLKVVPQSDFYATVAFCYFNGTTWLIEADYSGQSIFIEHKQNLKKGTIVFFSVVR